MQQSFLSHLRFRYLWFSIVLTLASITAYVLHRPVGEPNGGTWLGYTLGTIGGLLIYWLTWFGIRKRRYSSNVGSLRGWLSAHVYLGTSLIVIALLHCGFQFGWNLHTLAIVLMFGVIASGFFGVYTYLRYPTLMTRNRDSSTRGAMLEEIAELDQNMLALADGIDPKIHAMILRSIEKTRLGGGPWHLLNARDASDPALTMVRAALAARENTNAATAGPAKAPGGDMPTMFAVVDFLAGTATDRQAEALRKLIDLLSRKKSLATRVARDVQFQSLKEIWLYFHVPLTFALLAALTAHIISVFFYW